MHTPPPFFDASSFGVEAVGADLIMPCGHAMGAQVQACFERAAHLVLDDGRLLTLLSGMAQQSMRMINVTSADWPALRQALTLGESLTLTASALHQDRFRLPLANIPVWRTPRLTGGFPEGAQERLTQGQAWLERRGAYAQADDTLFRQTALERFQTVMGALGGPAEALNNAVRATVGLGPGLTPSGDDMLAGLLIGLRVTEAAPRADVGACIRRHQHGTTLASQDALDQASRGWLTARLGDVLAALQGAPDAPPLHDALHAQSTIGQHSGVDTLIGFFAGLAYKPEERHSR